MSIPDESQPSNLTSPLLEPSASASASFPPPISFVSSPRPPRDLPFLLLFLLLSLSLFALGIFSLVNHNPDRSCSPQNYNLANEYDNNYSLFVKNLSWTLTLTFLIAAPALVLLLLLLLRRFAKQLVYLSLPFLLLVPSLLNLYWFIACSAAPSCRNRFPLPYRILLLSFVFLLLALLLWILLANWRRIELTVKIIRVSAAALAENKALMLVLPMMTVGLLLYFVPVIVFLVFARWNGRAVVVGEKGECAWKQAAWVPAYYALAIIMMIWTAGVMVEAQVYVVSGTIAQWYFAEEGTRPRRSLRNSLRNAFGPSFGTVCFSGMVMGAIRVVRATVDSAEHEENNSGLVNLILSCCAKFLLAAFDFVNKFTINFAAITGEGYCSSAKMTYELLKRNLLSAVFVETVSTRILGGIVFVISTLYAVAVFAILKAVSDLRVEIYFVAALAWLLLILVLGYFVHVLDNVIDTIYVCYAIDRDKGDVSKQEVHEVYVLLPVSRKYRSSGRTPMLV